MPGLCCAKSLRSCLTLCYRMDCSPPGSCAWILQARTLEWAAMPSPRVSSQHSDRTHVSYVSCTGRRVFYHQHHLGSLLSGFTCPKYKLLTPRLSNLSTGRMGWGRTQGVPPLRIQGFCLVPLCSLPSRLEPSMCASSSIWAACSSRSPS